ncbi:MAG: DUF4856 domain-containing protein [Flavobacteriales bacterium]
MQTIVSKTFIKGAVLASFSVILMSTSCKKDGPIEEDKDDKVTIPTTYSFNGSDGLSSVDYAGQTDRINHLVELNNKLKTGDAGQLLNAQALKDMFANVGGNGSGNFTFTSSRQLKDKCFSLDASVYEAIYDSAAVASDSGAVGVFAANGKAGLIQRSTNATILVDKNGFEFTQKNQKGLMGAVFLYQIFNVYLSDAKLGDAVDNTTLVAGKNYTAMEHYADEAFGYFGAPIDFKANYTGTGTPRYWASYSAEMDAVLGCTDKIMLAFRTMRAAITNKDMATKNQQRDILYTELEKLVAACIIHYANEVLVETNQGNILHALSEMYGFMQGLKYNTVEKRKISNSELTVLFNHLGTNLWNVTSNGLNAIKDDLAARYGLTAVKNTL